MPKLKYGRKHYKAVKHGNYLQKNGSVKIYRKGRLIHTFRNVNSFRRNTNARYFVKENFK